jgi:hypothetical protein
LSQTPSLVEPEKPPPPAAAQVLDLLSKGLVSLSLISFLSGLVIKNFSLLGFGIAQFDPLRSEYIATGLVWFILSGTCVVMVWNTWRWESRRWAKPMRRREKWYELSLLPAAALGSGFFVLSILQAFRFSGAYFGGKALLAAGSLFVSAVIQSWTLGLFRSQPLQYLRQFASDNPSNLIRDLLITMLLTMASYAEFVYPNLPAMFGGGDRPNRTLSNEESVQFGFAA